MSSTPAEKEAEKVCFVIDDPERLTGRERSLLRHLIAQYTPEIARDVLRPIVTQTSPVSQRALDWTVVNWSKQHNVVCTSTVPGQSTNVHHAYRTTLQFWKRKLFDPFRRRGRVGVVIDGETYETTLGQANFALFAYRTGIYSYALFHLDAIEADMNRVAARQKQDRRDARARGIRRRRSELTEAPSTMCVAYSAPSRIRFDRK